MAQLMRIAEACGGGIVHDETEGKMHMRHENRHSKVEGGDGGGWVRTVFFWLQHEYMGK